VWVFRRPGVGEAMGSLICVAAVLAVLVAVDPDVHDHFTALISQASSDRLSTWNRRAGELGNAIIEAARDHSIDEAPLLVFTVVAAALLIFLLRN